MFVTYSTLKYRSLRSDRWGLILTRNLSIADGAYTFLVVLPVLLSNLTRSWVFGTELCRLAASLRYLFLCASTNFVTAVSIHRMLQGLSPLRDFIIFTEKSVAFSLLIWAYSSVVSIRLLAAPPDSVFDPEIAYCRFPGFVLGLENYIFTGVMLVLPFCIVMSSHLVLCHISRRQLSRTRRLRKQSLKAAPLAAKIRERRNIRRTATTLGTLSTLLLVSWLPNIIQHFLSLPGVRRWCFYLYFLNTAGNPIIYTLVNRDFKNYARRRIVSAISKDQAGSMYRTKMYTTKLSPLSTYLPSTAV